MADYYCDHGLYPAYADTPTWNTAQDGDGKAIGTATPALASILLNINVDSTGPADAVAIMGVTFTAGSNWTVGGSIAASADNLATAINASTTTVSTSVATNAPQLRDLVYARGPGTGAPAGKVEIMTRAGSADFNHATNSAVAITSANWATPPTIVQFVGGTSGAWGYLLNSGSVWKTGRGVASYGAYSSSNLAGPSCFASNSFNTTLTDADQIFVRTKASGTDKSIVFTTMSADGAYGGSSSTISMTLIFDNGVKWSGDSGQFTLQFSSNAGNRVGFFTNGRRIIAKAKYGLRFYCYANGGSFDTIFIGPGIYFAAGGGYSIPMLFENVLFETARTASQTPDIKLAVQGNNAAGQPVYYRFAGCKFKNGYGYSNPFHGYNAYSQNKLTYDCEDMEFEFNGIGAPPAGMFDIDANVQDIDMSFKQCRWTGWSGGFPLIGTKQSSDYLISITVDGCTGLSDSWLGISARSAIALVPSRAYGLFYSADLGRPMRYENIAGMCDWFYGAGYPTLSAQQQDGVYWSVRMMWRFSNVVNPSRPFVSPRFTKVFVDTSATKTIKAELLCDPTTPPTNGDVNMVVSYTDSSGVRRVQSTWAAGDTTALSAGSGSWAKNSYSTYNAKKLELTTAYAIKQNTEIDVRIEIKKHNTSGSLVYFFVDPDFVIS